MSKFLIPVIGLAALFPFARVLANRSPDHTRQVSPDSRQVIRLEEIRGLWHQFPGGISLSVDPSGAMEFGITADGRSIGYRADAWFDGEILFLRFQENEVLEMPCTDAVGGYRVELNDGDHLRFLSIGDECSVRSQMLGNEMAGATFSFQHAVAAGS